MFRKDHRSRERDKAETSKISCKCPHFTACSVIFLPLYVLVTSSDLHALGTIWVMASDIEQRLLVNS